MDIHQLRSWIFELFDPLDNERQYIVFDRERGNLLIDAPAFSERAVRLIRGAGGASLLLVTNATRGADAAKYRDALGLQIAAHADDATGIPGGADIVLRDDELVRPEARVVRVGDDGEGATVVLLRKAGGVLCCGDLDLTSDAARSLLKLQFSAVLSARREPMWNAGRDTLQLLQRELPQAKKRFGILLQAPWQRAYKGRLEDQMKPNPLIVPQDETAAREAAMGPNTLVVARETRARTEAAPRPARATQAVPAGAAAAVAAGASSRPRSFADDWSARATVAPPTTVANPAADIQPAVARYRPVPIGGSFVHLEIDTVAALPNVDFFWGGPDLSPDGAEVAFAWNQSGTFELYAAPLREDRIIQLTASGTRSVQPRWSPDGRQIAFVRDQDGDERFAIWLVDRNGDREQKLTYDARAMHRDIAWSPDGASIVCVANPGGAGFGIQLIDAVTGDRRPLTEGSSDDARPRFSPDGTTIAFDSRRSTDRTDQDLFLIRATGGEPVRLETRNGKPGVSLDPRWSPDGRTLSFTTNVRGRNEIALVDLDGVTPSTPRYLTENPFDESLAVWRPDGRGVVYHHDRDAAVQLHRVFAASRAATPVADLPGVYQGQLVGPDSETIVTTFASARRPADVWVRDGDQVTLRAITNSIGSAIDPHVLVEPSHVRYPSADGREIPALLFVPHAEAVTGTTGAVLWIHGGPTGQHLRWWDPTIQLLANRGLVVLAPNVRGSTGYGRAFQEANRGDLGGGDLADVMAGADWLAREGIADPSKLGIAGASYGGFMTLFALGRHPDRFQAGVSIVGIASWKTLIENARGDLLAYFSREFPDASMYAERSPITYADRIRAPLLVLQGAKDPRVPKTEALQIVAALDANGTPHEYHEYPDEGHGFTKTANRIDAIRRTVEWLERHLS